MADEMEGQLPRGVAVSRRHGAPPWQVSAGDRPSLHVVVQGSFQLARDEARVLDLEPGDLGRSQGAGLRMPRVRAAA